MSYIESSIESVLKNDPAVSALVGTRVYPVILPAAPDMPAITYRRSGPPEFCDSESTRQEMKKHLTLSGTSSLRNVWIQIKNWGSAYADVKALQAAVEAALAGATGFKAVPYPDRDEYDPDNSRYYVTQVFTIWY